MNIHFATDHAGFELKELLKQHLVDLGHAITDHGAFALAEGDDYPDFVTPAARAVAADAASGVESLGIILGGTGQGEAMCANRVPGVRAAVHAGGDVEIITLAREHNDANILSIGARFTSAEGATQAVDLFIATAFSGDERHVRRLAKF